MRAKGQKTTHRSRRIRLPEFMWLALDVLTEHVNQTAISDPEERIDVGGLIDAVLLTSIKVATLRSLAEASPEFQQAITAWVDWQIEHEPRTVAIFSSGLWNFTMRSN